MKRRFAFLAIGLLCAMGAFAQDFPAYLTTEGTVITGCDEAALPANLVIPEGVTEIGWNPFAECVRLKKVNYLGTKAQWKALKVSLRKGTVVHCADGDLVQE